MLGLLAKAKTDFMSLDHPDPNHIGIFAYLRWTTEVGVAFQMAYPQYSQIAVRAVNANFFPRPFNDECTASRPAFYRRLVEVGQDQGDIDPNIDPALAAVIFDGALTGIGNYMLDKFASGEIPLKLDGDDMFNMPEISRIFTAAVDLLEYGMRKQGPSQVTGQVQAAEGRLAPVSGMEGG